MQDYERIVEATHQALLQIAREYMDGKRDNQALNGVMVRLLLRSLETDLTQHSLYVPIKP